MTSFISSHCIPRLLACIAVGAAGLASAQTFTPGNIVVSRSVYAGVPSSAALLELKKDLPANMIIRRCPRLHAKAVIIDARAMYLGSANLTGAGLGAKADGRRNFEWGIWTISPELIEATLDAHVIDIVEQRTQVGGCRPRNIKLELRQQRAEQRRLVPAQRMTLAPSEERAGSSLRFFVHA